MKRKIQARNTVQGAGAAIANFNFMIILNSRSPDTLAQMPELASSKGVITFFVMKSLSPLINIVFTSLPFHSQPEIRVCDQAMAFGSAPASN